MELNDSYWTDRYTEKRTGWDIGQVSTPLKEYIDQLPDKDLRILIPGCGNAYEAAYLVGKGFRNITLIDISAKMAEDLAIHFAHEPAVHVIHGDFFTHEGSYDLVLEQTFFCAIDPMLRQSYVTKMHSLLAPGGKIAGVLFNRSFEGGPPFGGNQQEYEQLFSKWFQIKTMSPCYNSIPPRAGAELFIILEKMRS